MKTTDNSVMWKTYGNRMKKVILTECQLNCILLEGDSRLKKLEIIIRNTFSNQFNVDDTVNSETYYVNANPNTTWLEYIMFSFRHNFGLMSNSDVKYIPEFGRIAITELGFESENAAISDLNFLKRVVQIVKTKPELFEKYVKGKDYQAVYKYFKPIIQQQDEEENNRINNMDYSNSSQDYEILEQVEYETAHQIGNYSSPKGELCYTQTRNIWNNYTEHGKNAVYILLKKGWKNIKPKHTECLLNGLDTEESPYDEYGLSMIFVFVDYKGELTTCNTRWNHDADYPYGKQVDFALNKEELSRLIGKPFKFVFKPKAEWRAQWKVVDTNKSWALVYLRETENNPEKDYNIIDTTNGKQIFPNNFKVSLDVEEQNQYLWLWLIGYEKPSIVLIDKDNNIYQCNRETEMNKFFVFYDDSNRKYLFNPQICDLAMA